VFIVHARKAWLKGLSPKENREIPPLEYARVVAIKQRHPELTWVLNGGLTDLVQVENWLQPLDQPASPRFQGVMLGREIYQNPYWLAQVDHRIFGDDQAVITREQVFAEFLRYASEVTSKGTQLHHLTRHILGLYAHQPGGRYFRRYITEHSRRADGLTRLYALLDDIRARSPA
jgi:tRNA-dihydrouridine synthase A